MSRARACISRLPAVCLTLSGCFLAFSTALAGVDNAANYSVWVHHGHRGDVEFDRWSLEVAAHGGGAGHYLGAAAPHAGNIDTDGKSFVLFAQPASNPVPFAAAVRRWAKPALTTGDRLSFQVSVNFRNGNKGFDLRGIDGANLWNFDVRSGGYRIGGNDLVSLGPYHANTVFTFTFTQRERTVDYSIERSGGVARTVTGSFPAASGTLADVRFYISGTESNDARNNLFLNNFSLDYARLRDAPLTLGERRMPGWNPSYILRFRDPAAATVTMRHGGDGFATSYPLSKGADGVWSVDIRNILVAPGGPPLQPGWHDFKFRLDGQFESGPNRRLYLDAQGRMVKPPAVYLGWQRSPDTTMTVHWLGQGGNDATVEYRLPGASSWLSASGSVQPFPLTERTVHVTELTGLNPDTVYEFRVGGDPTVRRFRTMPSALSDSRPVRFIVGGDRDYGAESDAMTRMVAAWDPDFVVIGGDILNSDNHALEYNLWYRVVETWSREAVRPDGTLVPLVVTIGNHDMRHYFASSHPDFEPTRAWRERVAPHYYRLFSFPNHPGYGALDFGDYLSLLLLDTDHTNEIPGAQTAWLADRLNERRNFRHLIPVYHVPAYPSNRGFNDTRNAQIRAHWLPLFERAGVRVAFEHHDHAFKRTKPLLAGREDPDGIVFLGDGGWGMPQRTPDTSRWYLAAAEARRHVYLLTLTPSARRIQALDRDGNVFQQIDQPRDGVPAAPQAVIAGLAGNLLALSWASVPRATKYKIVRSDGFSIETSGTSHTDTAWTPSSGFSYVIEAINRSGHSTNHPTVAAAPRKVWALTNNLPWDGSGEGGPEADPDSDGLVNLAEYFHGMNPRAPDAAGPIAFRGFEGGNVSLRYRVNGAATDVSGRMEWTPVLDPAAWTTNGVTESDLTGDWSGWRAASLPVTNGMSSGFMRLRITK